MKNETLRVRVDADTALEVSKIAQENSIAESDVIRLALKFLPEIRAQLSAIGSKITQQPQEAAHVQGQ